MPEPPKITTSLAERIAKLNANVINEKSNSSSSTSGLPGEIKSKISKYEATGQHEAPLVPKGSFGLGAPLVASSRGLDRMRIASLGVSGGQAPVSLVPSRSSVQRSQSGQHYRHTSGASDVSNSPPNSGRPSQRHGSGDSVTLLKNLSLAPAPPLTPSAMSVNSARAELGSERNSPLPTPVQISQINLPTTASEPDDETRAKTTKEELAKFEAEVTDPIARPITVDNATTSSSADGAPIEPPALTSESISRSSSQTSSNLSGGEKPEEDGTDSHEAYDGILDAYPVNSSVEGSMNGDEEADMPMVKCADCGVPLSLMMLSDHVCETSPVTTIKPENTRPVPSDVPIDAHETNSNTSEFEIHPILVEPLSESEMDDLPEGIDNADEFEVEQTTDKERIPPINTNNKSTNILPAQPSPTPSLNASTRHSWDDDEDEEQGGTGFATIVRRSRG
ncbi:uncharacterized protein MELLADRAFT_72155 [Melampsora larici-populina 98AG31]|uniref:Uncharacterized protein n=1 Tax=Melampsora larici-populina (strain 98AG31 / pathotype 3-4-7) TaxID=747676 RepID=F4RQA9_MELLP|nr:uncharacterized protein MELLADRAFT_72155 [Melampsora larici-populina 98AG31]EGG05373.1 hypothetical protein MELLADRAFT_72155 [Melampsora larici-populina 98AG31]